MKVRRLQCTKDLGKSFSNGEIFIEYGTIPGFFYHEKEENPVGSGFCLERLKLLKIDQYFIEIEPVDFKETIWYEISKEDLNDEIEILETSIKVSQERLEELRNLLKKF